MPEPVVYDAEILKTGELTQVTEATLIRNSCGNCGHGFLEHLDPDEPHPYDVAGISDSFKPVCRVKIDPRMGTHGGCSCGTGWIPKYRIIGRHKPAFQSRFTYSSSVTNPSWSVSIGTYS